MKLVYEGPLGQGTLGVEEIPFAHGEPFEVPDALATKVLDEDKHPHFKRADESEDVSNV